VLLSCSNHFVCFLATIEQSLLLIENETRSTILWKARHAVAWVVDFFQHAICHVHHLLGSNREKPGLVAVLERPDSRVGPCGPLVTRGAPLPVLQDTGDSRIQFCPACQKVSAMVLEAHQRNTLSASPLSSSAAPTGRPYVIPTP
jgi:hypothetical protein